MIPVVWFSADPDQTPPRGYWDQAIVEDLLAGELWRTSDWPTFVHHEPDVPDDLDGCVLVVPARHHADGPRLEGLLSALQRLSWCVLILTGDEEGVFPRAALEHPRLRVWVQTAYPDGVQPQDRPLPNGYGPDTRRFLRVLRTEAHHRPLDWFFAGQVNTPGREELVDVLKKLPDGHLQVTSGFLQGMPYPQYAALLASARLVPCPSGPFTPDTFRVAEALEAGCVPIVEIGSVNRGDYGYWPWVWPDAPVPMVERWDELQGVLDRVDWPGTNNAIWAWWRAQKRQMAMDLIEDLRAVGAPEGPAGTISGSITVLIPTSATPLDPSTDALEEVVRSIRERLPDAPIIVMCDGIRPELEHRSDAYQEYLHRVLWLAHHHWTNVLPLVADEHLHQSGLTRWALDLVDTPFVLFVEHDTPLVGGEVEWEGLCAALRSDAARVIRLHHEASVLPEHEELMLGPVEVVEGVRLRRTMQWSQRPHLATADFYRWMLRTYFGHAARTMIEDSMHGVVSTTVRTYDMAGWTWFRLWMYTPEDPIGIKRSGHLDTRGDDPKAGCWWAYDTEEIPFGAPTPSALRDEG